MIKRLLATNLILALIINSFNLKTNALIPTDYEDPNCINLTSLGVGRDFITYNGSQKAICGCRTCTVDAMLYGKIEEYVKALKRLLRPLSEITQSNNQDKVNSEAKKLAAVNLAYIAPPIAVLLKPLVRDTDFYTFSKIAFFIVEASDIIIGILYKVSETQYKTMFFENKAKLDNVNAVFRQISKDIEKRRFKNKNFLLVSTNYNPTSAGAIAQFAKKDGIENDDEYNEEYFNRLNEEIKPILEEIDRQVFPTYDNVEYNKEVRDVLKAANSITLPTSVLLDAYFFLTGQGGNIDQFIDQHKVLIATLGTGFWGALYAFFNGKGIGSETSEELKDIVEKGAKTLKIIYDEDKNPSRNNFIKLRQGNGVFQRRDENDLL